jgi:predicted methyltransferase
MIPRAIPLLALVTALCAACSGRSPQNAPAVAAPAQTHEHSSGSERGCPDLQTYSGHLDEPERDEWQRPREVVELLECRAGMTVVDLGAGTGYFLRYLSEAAGHEGQVLALDISSSSVKWVSSRIEREGLQNVQPKMVARDDPALSPRSVDRILVANTWHHISGRVDYARRLLAALRPGGVLLIVDFTIDSPEGPPPKMRLTYDTVMRELEVAGFAAEVVQESLPYQYVVAGRVPQLN